MGLMSVALYLQLVGLVGRWGNTPAIDYTGRNIGGEPFGPSYNTGEGDIAINEEYGIGGVVVAVHKATAALCAEAFEVGWGAQDIVSQWMIREERAFEIIKDEFGRVVFIALYLFEDDTTLLIGLVLRKGAVEDDVGEQFKSPGKVLLQKSRVHHRLFLVGESIEVATYILHAVEDVPCATLRGSFEEHVLHEVGKTRFIGLLIACAGINGIAAVGNSCGRGGVDDAQAVR